MMTIGGVGLALGAVFLYMLSRPEKAAAAESGVGGQTSNAASGAGSRTPGQRAA